jgi:hypothetical protein
MANAAAKVLADDILNWFKGTTFPATLANTYVALLTTNPTKNDGTGLVECSDSAYAREAVASSGWSAISLNADNIHDEISNSAVITFPAVAGAAYTVVGLAIYSAVTAGSLLAYGAVTSQAVSTGNSYQIAIGSLIMEF